MKPNRTLITAVAVAFALAALAWGGWSWWQRRHAAPDGLLLFGHVDIRQVSLAFNANDRVAALQVSEGDRVTAGQRLGRLDTRTLELRVAQSEAQIAVQEQAVRRLRNGSRPQEIAQARGSELAAQAEADLAAQQWSRLRATAQASAGRAVSQQDLDTAQARLRSTQAQLDNARQAASLTRAGARREDIGQAEAQLAAARADLALMAHALSEAELVAPVDGVVRSRLLEPGDMASPEKPVYTLAITRPKWVRAYATETQLGLLKPGQAARVTTDSHPGEAVAGRVGYIGSVAEFTPKTVQTEELRTSLVYEVRIEVDDAQDRLRLGMPATVRIEPAAPAQ